MILHPFHISSTGTDFPEKMNNPFDYEPHPLCIQICKELQTYLENKKEWREEIDRGKMFGVLIVEKPSDIHEGRQLGYLAAYSGQIGGRSDWDDFVPAVFDYLQPDGYFKTHEAEITHINESILRLEKDERMQKARTLIADLLAQRQQTIADFQEKMKEKKAQRDLRRKQGNLSAEEEQAMTKESQFMKAELRRLKKSLAEKTTLETEYEDYQNNISRLKQLRKQLSDALQQWLFAQFRMLNAEGEEKDLLEIFRDTALEDQPNLSLLSKRAALKMVPPAGSGECCEPKLLQYAFRHHLKPLQMAMFWWGESPKEEIRHHLQFYPACNGKCKPILRWMLPEVNTMLNQASQPLTLETLYEDRELAVICKPARMLSVPGKEPGVTSVYSIMRGKYPEATGPLIVHRLDMATSGLMVIAKTEFAYHRLQEQFASHQIQKKYIAIVCAKEGSIQPEGLLSLPLMPDYLDRPRQIVNHEQGKEAITEYKVLGNAGNDTFGNKENKGNNQHLRLALYPQTGRTHQLRVHCAHREGLNAPILGDPLYGCEKAPRLYLHAESIRFTHPLSGKEIFIERKADF